MLTCGARRVSVVRTSRKAAPCGDVTMPIGLENAGSGALVFRANNPSSSSLSLRRQETAR
jgi:hypothetical protein